MRSPNSGTLRHVSYTEGLGPVAIDTIPFAIVDVTRHTMEKHFPEPRLPLPFSSWELATAMRAVVAIIAQPERERCRERHTDEAGQVQLTGPTDCHASHALSEPRPGATAPRAVVLQTDDLSRPAYHKHTRRPPQHRGGPSTCPNATLHIILHQNARAGVGLDDVDARGERVL